MNEIDERMLDPKIEKYLLRKKGVDVSTFPVGLIKYGELYKDAKGDKAKQRTILNILDREIKSFKLGKAYVYKVLGI